MNEVNMYVKGGGGWGMGVYVVAVTGMRRGGGGASGVWHAVRLPGRESWARRAPHIPYQNHSPVVYRGLETGVRQQLGGYHSQHVHGQGAAWTPARARAEGGPALRDGQPAADGLCQDDDLAYGAGRQMYCC